MVSCQTQHQKQTQTPPQRGVVVLGCLTSSFENGRSCQAPCVQLHVLIQFCRLSIPLIFHNRPLKRCFLRSKSSFFFYYLSFPLRMIMSTCSHLLILFIFFFDFVTTQPQTSTPVIHAHIKSNYLVLTFLIASTIQVIYPHTCHISLNCPFPQFPRLINSIIHSERSLNHVTRLHCNANQNILHIFRVNPNFDKSNTNIRNTVHKSQSLFLFFLLTVLSNSTL